MESVSREKLKSFVKAKFGSLRRYCNLTGQFEKYGYLRKFLASKKKLTIRNEIMLRKEYNKAKRADNKPLINEISHENRVRIVNFICVHYITNSNFCRYNQGVTTSSLSAIISGKTKKKTPTFYRIMEIIELKESKKWKK